MAINTLTFGDRDAVGGDPLINGMVDPDFLPYYPGDTTATPPIPPDVEPGYVGGSRLTFAGGALPRVFFQGVRTSDDRLAMAFFTRFNTGFSESDYVVIAVRTDFASASPARLIVIHPNLAGVGATAGTGDGPNEIKRNADPPDFDVYQGVSGSWTQITPPPASLKVKVRSWKPQRPSGSPTECAWSIELSMPRSGAADWITLNNDFGLYFDVVRVFPEAAAAAQSPFPTAAPSTEEPSVTFPVPAWGHGLIPGIQVPPGSNTGLGVRVKNGWQGIGRRALGTSGPLEGTIQGPSGSADNELVAVVENTSPDAANGVTAEFRFVEWGTGPGAFNQWDRPLGITTNPTSAGNLAGTAQPTMPTTVELKTSWLRAAVSTEYEASPHRCVWVQLSAGGTVNFTESSVRRNMDFVGFSDVERDAVVSGEGYPDPANGSDAHQFMLQTFCREIRVAELVGQEKTDEDLRALVEDTIMAVSPPRLSVNMDSIALGARTQNWEDVVVYLWVTQAYRRMGSFIKIKGKLYENLDETPGEFGLSALHQGVKDNFGFAFSGPDLVQYAPGSYGLKVPNGGKVRLKVKVGASPDGPPGDRSELPKAPWPKHDGSTTGGSTPGKDGKGCSLALIILSLGLAAPLLLLRLAA